MRIHLLAIVLMAGVAAPAAAQSGQQPERVERRLDKIEQELRAVQRRVFPGGNVEPEIVTRTPQSTLSGVPASNAVADISARLDALESQLATLTGQSEENANRLRQLETALSRFRETAGSRLDVLERQAAPAVEPEPAAPSRPAAGAGTTSRPASSPASTPASTAAGSGTDAAEEAYNAGFRLWDQGRYTEAQTALEAMARKYPRHRLASWASNLAGRAYLDGGKPAAAARVFLANYQGNPKGERAADSLFFLGQALFKLNKPADACKAYDELQDVYGDTIRAYLKQRLPTARAEAKCR
jgi:TolA-binding protein